MRIALYHNLPSGGAKRAVLEWTQQLATTHSIDVFTLSSADHSFCDLRPHVKKYEIFEFSPRKLFNSPLGRLNQFQRWRDLGDLVTLNQRIADTINDDEYDVLFANTCKFTFIPSIIQFVDIPSVYYLHEPFGAGFVRSIHRPYAHESGWRKTIDQFDPLIKMYRNRMESIQKTNAKRTTRLLANSNFTREWMKVTLGIDAPVSTYGVDLVGFRLEPEIQRQDFVLSVGELSPRKGFDFIVESLGLISPTRRPILVLACNRVEPAEQAFVLKLAIDLGVDLQVRTGLGTDELRTLYNQARLCVYAPVLEPFGLVPLEAMACETPVVGVKEGGVQESVIHQKTGLLVERDPNQFAAAVEGLLANPELCEEYGKNGRRHVLENWTWERSVDQLERHLIDCSLLSPRKFTDD